jgi:UDP-glucose 4-epimerase
MSRKTAIVTGGAGFVGSHLVDSLLGDGYRVVVIDDLSTGAHWRLAPEADLENLDIAGRGGAVEAALERARPSRVFHLAGQGSVTVSVAEPERDCRVNVLGTMAVLQAAEQVQAPVVFTSTGGVYGDGRVPSGEDDWPEPTSPYGTSKLAAEGYIRMFSLGSRMPHAICRPGVIYGPRQSPHGESGAVAIFSRQLWRGERPVLYGAGRPTRDYVHVFDVVDALRRASGTAGTFNVATGVETPTRELLAELQRAAGTSIEPVLAPLRAGEIRRSRLNPEHTAQVLGWRARMTLSEGLAQAYAALVAGFEQENVPAQADVPAQARIA